VIKIWLIAYLNKFLRFRGLHELGGELLLNAEDYTLAGLDADSGGSKLHHGV